MWTVAGGRCLEIWISRQDIKQLPETLNTGTVKTKTPSSQLQLIYPVKLCPVMCCFIFCLSFQHTNIVQGGQRFQHKTSKTDNTRELSPRCPKWPQVKQPGDSWCHVLNLHLTRTQKIKKMMVFSVNSVHWLTFAANVCSFLLLSFQHISNSPDSSISTQNITQWWTDCQKH